MRAATVGYFWRLIPTPSGARHAHAGRHVCSTASRRPPSAADTRRSLSNELAFELVVSGGDAGIDREMVYVQGIFGPKFRVTASRGVPQESDLAEFVVATIHPSAILRSADRREAEMAAFTQDLAAAWVLLRD